ncbi:MAG: hypothetical protein K6E50_14850 [Lachnospiraceae bacterium]|nr:hypothetical protein [Lachnospiraceae bacterium]
MNERIEQILNEMNRYMPAGTMQEFLYLHKKIFWFKVSFSKKELEEDIAVLDISVRGNHCLKRAGLTTIGALVNAIFAKDEETSKQQLLRVRSLGKKTAEEILLMLMCYQFKVLPEAEKRQFVLEIVEMNLGNGGAQYIAAPG